MKFIRVSLDTGLFVELAHKKDDNYERSKGILNQLATSDYGLLYTSIFIVSESFTLAVVRSNNNIKVLDHIYMLIWGSDKIASVLPFDPKRALLNVDDAANGSDKIASVLPFDPDLELDTWNLFKKVNTIDLKSEKPMSFVDISSVILCQRYQIDKSISFDPHFDRLLTRIS